MADTPISENPTNPSVISWVALALGVGIVVSAGTLYGRYSQRWGPPTELVSASANLAAMPTQIGQWRMVEELEMKQTVLAQLECAGYANRRYINEESGQMVTVAIIVGPPGPTAVHRPEICFSSRAYKLQSPREAVTVDDTNGISHTFWRVDFKTRDIMADQLRVCYAWNPGDQWIAAESPRFEFAAAPLLFKIQIASSIESRTTNNDNDACRQFFKDLITSNWTVTGTTTQRD